MLRWIAQSVVFAGSFLTTCGGWLFAQDAHSERDSKFQVGVAIADVTPPLGYPMSGYY